MYRGLGIIISVVCITVAMGASPASATTCSGKWGGQASTTIQLKSGNKVRYCYRSECYNTTFSGSLEKGLSFTVVRGGAVVTVKPSGKNYSGVWRYQNQRATATLRCK
jgi:hypothetical protein